MLFQSRFHAGIKQGSVTHSFRAWSSPRVKVGGRYRVGTIGTIEVDAVDPVSVRQIRAAEARASGFADRAELISYLERAARRRLPPDERLYRVRFHHAGRDTRPAPNTSANLSAQAMEELAARLGRMDARSRHGPWTRRTLALIARRPETAASRLAPSLQRPTAPFKADVRKLKKLGLTTSLEVGYRITPRGNALLAHWRKRR